MSCERMYATYMTAVALLLLWCAVDCSVITIPLTHHRRHNLKPHAVNTTHHSHHLMVSANSVVVSGCVSDLLLASVTISGQGPFQLIVDTGSSTLGVASEYCTSCANTSPVYAFSTSYGSLAALYGIGSWGGYTVMDSVSVGTSSSVSMYFGAITSSSNWFDSGSCTDRASSTVTYQGIIGMAYSSLDLYSDTFVGTNSWLDQYTSTFELRNAFALNLVSNPKVMTIGGYTGNISTAITIPINAGGTLAGFYSVNVAAMVVGNTIIHSSTWQQGTILDSGTNSIIVSSDVYTQVTNALMQNQWFMNNLYVSGQFFQGFCFDTCAYSPCITEATLNNELPNMGVVFTDSNGYNPQTVYIQPTTGYIDLIQYETNGLTYTYIYFTLSNAGSSFSQSILGLQYLAQFETFFNKQAYTASFFPLQCPQCQIGNLYALYPTTSPTTYPLSTTAAPLTTTPAPTTVTTTHATTPTATTTFVPTTVAPTQPVPPQYIYTVIYNLDTTCTSPSIESYEVYNSHTSYDGLTIDYYTCTTPTSDSNWVQVFDGGYSTTGTGLNCVTYSGASMRVDCGGGPYDNSAAHSPIVTTPFTIQAYDALSNQFYTGANGEPITFSYGAVLTATCDSPTSNSLWRGSLVDNGVTNSGSGVSGSANEDVSILYNVNCVVATAAPTTTAPTTLPPMCLYPAYGPPLVLQ